MYRGSLIILLLLFCLGLNGSPARILNRPQAIMVDYGHGDGGVFSDRAWCINADDYIKQMKYIVSLNHTINNYEEMIHEITCGDCR